MSDRKTQSDRILALLRTKEWVTLPEILDLRIANYRARISELREAGYDIPCLRQNFDGTLHTQYSLRGEPAPAVPACKPALSGSNREQRKYKSRSG